jgi:hypothetical protein
MSKLSLNSGFCIQDDWISPHDSEAPKLKPPELTMRYDQNASNLGMQSARHENKTSPEFIHQRCFGLPICLLKNMVCHVLPSLFAKAKATNLA